jgi:hypothetical protein
MDTIAKQQPRAVDGKVATDLTSDADTTIDFADGSTYRWTATLSTNRNISLPVTGIGTYERFHLRVDADLATYNLVVKELGGNNIATFTAAAATDDGLTAYWDDVGSHWYCLHWSGSDVTVNQ